MLDLRLAGIGDGTCPPRTAVSGGIRFYLYFFFSCFVMCIPLVFYGTVCLCIAQILLVFMLASF
jgi:hypothetical protein